MIVLGIRKWNHPYRGSRGGTRIFHHIYSIVLGIGNAFNYVTLTGNLPRTIQLAKLVPIQACQAKSMIHSTSACLHGALLNCWLAINKSQDSQLEVTTNDFYFCALNETWLKTEINVIPLCLCPNDYNILSVPRKDK